MSVVLVLKAQPLRLTGFMLATARDCCSDGLNPNPYTNPNFLTDDLVRFCTL